MKRRWVRYALLMMLAALTALAFSMDIPVPLMEEAPADTMPQRLARMLNVLYRAIADNHPQTMLIAGGAFCLYQRLLLGEHRRRLGEYVLAAFFAVCMLFSMATQATNSASVLWANMTQLCKAVIMWAGFVPMWLCAIRAVDLGLNWLIKQKTFSFRRPLLTPMLILMALWLPQALIRYPGAVIFDTFHQMREFFGDTPFLAMNPPAHTAMLGLFVSFGDWLGYPHFGMFLITLVQMITLSWILAWLLCLMQRLKMPALLTWVFLGSFALLPTYSAYVTTVLKDTACSIAVLLFMIQTALMVIRPEIFWEHKGRGLVLWAVSGVLGILMRKNGIAMVAPTIVVAGLYALGRSEWGSTAKRWLPLASGILAIAVAYGSLEWVTAKYDVGGSTIRELLSIPLQQTARVLRENDVPQEEVDIINEVLDAELAAQVYVSHVSDEVKTTYRQDTTTAELLAYAKVWAKHLIRYPSSCLDALTGMTHTIFSPMGSHDDFYDVNIVQSINHGKWQLDEWLQVSPLSRFRQPLKALYMLMLKLPGTGVMLNLGVHIILTLVLAYYSFRRGRRGLWIIWLPTLLCLILLLFSPITCIRYALPNYYGLPVLLAVVCHERMYQKTA